MNRFLATFIFLACPVVVRGAEPLNLLIVTTDDMNADSSGWMGSKLGATPNLDAFAETCSRFVHCHVSAPICQPSRSALMTGRVPHRNGALGFNPIRLEVPTLVEVLKARGYLTAGINKVEHMAPATKFPWDLRLNGSGKNPAAFRTHVEEVLKAAREKGRPFFLNANITDPHRPFPNVDADGKLGPPALAKAKAKAKQRLADANERIAKVYKPAEVVVPSFLEAIPKVRQEVAQYFTSVARFDVSFGAVLSLLKEAGQEEKTVVAFLSDHGMSFPYSKATLYRNGTWSPLLIR